MMTDNIENTPTRGKGRPKGTPKKNKGFRGTPKKSSEIVVQLP